MRIENIIEWIDGGAIAEALAFLPLSLCFNAIHLKTISHGMRTNLLRISFFLICKLYELRRNQVDSNPERTSKIGGRRFTIFTSQWTVTFLNTALNLLLCVSQYDGLALDQVGSPPFENFFARLRRDARDINSIDEMERTITHPDIVREARRGFGPKKQLQNRINIGGVHIDRGHLETEHSTSGCLRTPIQI
jgi:hypothetical protein